MEIVNTYGLKEMADREKLYPTTVKNRYNYIPIKITTGQTKANYRAGNSSKDYMIKYIKLEDILEYLSQDIDFTFVRKKPK